MILPGQRSIFGNLGEVVTLGERGDPGTRWYRVRLPRADTFSTWTPGSAVVTLATSGPNGKAEFGGSTPAGCLSIPTCSPKYVTVRLFRTHFGTGERSQWLPTGQFSVRAVPRARFSGRFGNGACPAGHW